MMLRTQYALAWLLKQPDFLIEKDDKASRQYVQTGGRSFSGISLEAAIEAAYEALYMEEARDQIRREEG